MDLILIIVAIYLFIKVLKSSLKVIKWVIANGLLGYAILFAFNFYTKQASLNFSLDIDLFNIFVTGIFGIPGIIYLIATKVGF